MAYCYLRDDETGFEFDRLEPPTNEPVQKYLNVWFDFAVNRLYFAGEELKEEPNDGFTLVCETCTKLYQNMHNKPTK